MRVGILGGTFDPVHYGHLLLAETCRQKLNLDRICFLPAGIPPHKQSARITSGHQRVSMLRLAISGYPEFEVDLRELEREGPSYTVDSLSELRHEQPDAELFFLMGTDSLSELMTWREPQRIAQLAQIVACNRPGLPEPTTSQIENWVTAELASRIRVVQIPGTALSSSELRSRVSQKRGLRFMTPRAVEAYIDAHRLYLDESERGSAGSS